ncbi:hypothetical protein [Cohnella fermenti]|uniref:Uncharacterized protein n=1 Tax=Cohnella fermenti TaxID=2565925 RepID=A0A4S4BNT3_9BACL|nr:hypothetical protein [Cohnella fermenti]THF76536.1 hypothetical protein E6C55_18545 [Cohnella fermenti]
MTAILFIYGLIAAIEWRYTRTGKHNKHSRLLIFGFIALLLLLSELLYLIKLKFQLAEPIIAIFNPLEKLLK